MKSVEISQPCRNFCILGSELIDSDPRDGAEKYAITTYVAGGIGKLILIDTNTLKSESYDFPSDEGAWAIMHLKEEEKLILGTCATEGSLHSFDLKTRSFEQPLRLDTETYLWNFARGKDGNVYASTYPGCNLVEYNPRKHTLESAGRVGDTKGNLYSRFTYTNADGNILVNAGYANVEAYLYDVEKKCFVSFGEDGDCIQGVDKDYIHVKNGSYHKFYDPYTLKLIEVPLHEDQLETLTVLNNPAVIRCLTELLHPISIKDLPLDSRNHMKQLKDGRFIGIKGQELFIVENLIATYQRIPALAPATAIMTISMDQNDALWGSSTFGQTIFSYHPMTKIYHNTSAVANAGGEVYGITHINDLIYLTSYVGGDHIVYDPNQPWNQLNNINPKVIGSLAPEMVRPHGKSVIGPDQNVWTGWWANYGVYGGGISKIDTKTNEVTSWFNLIPEHAIEHITASQTHLYAITCGDASGLSAKKDGFYLLQLDTDCDILWKKQFAPGIHLKKVAIVGSYLIVSLVDTNNCFSKLLVFDELSLQELYEIELGHYTEQESSDTMVTELLPYDKDLIIAFMKKKAVLINVTTGDILSHCEIDGPTETAAIDSNKNMYFAVRQKLYQLYL